MAKNLSTRCHPAQTGRAVNSFVSRISNMRRRKTGIENDKIKVLLIAKEDLVLEGWSRVLSQAADIELLASINNFSLNTASRLDHPPEIIVAHESWLRSPKVRKWISQVRTKYRTKIIAVVRNTTRGKSLRMIGVDESIQSPFGGQQLINLIRGLSRDDKNLCMYYAQQLESMPRGAAHFGTYIELISNILQLTFSRAFSNPQMKSTYSSGERFVYLTFENRSDHRFWNGLKKSFGTHYVLFSIQNNPALLTQQFGKLGKYLVEPVGKLGFLCNRQAPEDAFDMLQVAAFQNDGKLILLLSDKQLRTLLAFKAAGVEPTELIEEIYQHLVVAIRETEK